MIDVDELSLLNDSITHKRYTVIFTLLKVVYINEMLCLRGCDWILLKVVFVCALGTLNAVKIINR